jgi:hypothetical protein
LSREDVGLARFVCLLRDIGWEGKDFGFNHKIMIKVQELLLGIMVTMNTMVCESPGKGLVVHEEDASPLVHST